MREALPDLAASVHIMEVAHDTICGSLARMVHLASAAAAMSTVATLFDRFESAYAVHASTESELLDELNTRLTDAQRAELAALVAGL